MKRRNFLFLAYALFAPRLGAQSTPDFHLRPGSPAIRAGLYLTEVKTDFDGVIRSDHPSAGAYELATALSNPPSPRELNVK